MEEIFIKTNSTDEGLRFSLSQGSFRYEECYEQEVKIQTGKYLVGILMERMDDKIFGLCITISKPDGDFLTNYNRFFTQEETDEEIIIPILAEDI
jgi:hypothetical protein